MVGGKDACQVSAFSFTDRGKEGENDQGWGMKEGKVSSRGLDLLILRCLRPRKYSVCSRVWAGDADLERISPHR